ncbi:hypothetical protein BDN70DRAFT_849974 [Pholiota conissans]|uniref:G domain-containing protein n=1 Tax=Pholiota conissans TaxID=109636 RepID=A0A9P5ZAC5_9AGAR|nr:hypothetical protein BDN70DRAFT_849974 [Pholiota conissans]
MTSKPKWKRREKMLTKSDVVMPDPQPTDIVVPIMGATGAGKSMFINKLLGEGTVPVGHRLVSCTEQLKPIIVKPGDHPSLRGLSGRLVIVDTPGFDDTYVEDAEILRRISVWLAASYSDSMKLGGVIFLHEISQVRMLGTALTNTNVFRKLCGDSNMSSVILATSKWEIKEWNVCENREAELKKTFWSGMLDAGARKARFLNNKDSAWEILNLIIMRQLRQNILQIQEELVIKQKIIPDTEAARSLRISLEQALEMHRKAAADGKTTQEQIDAICREISQLKVTFRRRILAAFGGV